MKRLKAKEVEIVLDNAANEFVIEKGYDPNYGARPMRRAVEKYLEDPLAEEVLRGTFRPGDVIYAAMENNEIVFRPTLPDEGMPTLDEPAAVA